MSSVVKILVEMMDSDGVPRKERSRLAPWFFTIWTAGVALAVWWLVAEHPNRADLLIALDRSGANSWLARARDWLEAHVEIYWVYPWILLAPYVLGLGLKFAIEKSRLTWRLPIHLAFGAGFIAASQVLTNRLEAMRPKAVFLREEKVVRRMAGDGTNDSTNAVFSWTTEWRGRDGKAGFHRVLGDAPPFAAYSNSPAGTNPGVRTAAERARVLIWRTEGDPFAATAPLPTNSVFNTALTNATAMNLASRLAPLLEEELKTLRGRHVIVGRWRLGMAMDGLAYLALMGLAQALHFRRRLRERETQAALLESKLTQSRLHALQAQLQPHFLFNALNGIATLVRRDPRVAEEMLTSLSDLLRISLANTSRQEIQLREELAFLDRYLELQEMRFGGRLRVARSIDPEALDCLVPSLLFQPLVENAIRHGLEPSPYPGTVRIGTERRDGQIVLTVEDNGCGLSGSKPPAGSGNGLGLKSVRERLAGLYGEGHEFAFQEDPGGGVSVRIAIPARLGERGGL